ncbi:MAG: trigger factor [Candidatus Eremiobacteraeota bacterium]|nr:trigger factor [Candidatus Eremiobacteraeota bacterium]
MAPTQVELEIIISATELAKAQERAFKKLARNVRLPGFRPGKVPRRVFEQNYGVESIENQAMEDVVPEVYAKAVREHDLEPVSRPSMQMLPEEDGQPYRIKATVEVRPQIELGTYKGIEVKPESAAVTDEDVDRSLQSLARERATLVPVERASKLGDVVTLDYAGTIDGVPFDGGTAKAQLTELDEGRFIPGFASGIAGLSAGESKDVTATFPAEYGQADLAGKDAVFAVTVHDVKEFELPLIDDAFAQSVSENKTAADLRADVRKRLEAIGDARRRREIGNAVMEKLLASHEVALPDSMVEGEVGHMLEEGEQHAARAGASFDDYLKQSGKTVEQLREEFRPEAKSRVKGTLLIEAIAKAEGVVATPADIADELQTLAAQYGQPVDRIRKALGNNVLSLMDGIVRTKTMDLLVDAAKTP